MILGEIQLPDGTKAVLNQEGDWQCENKDIESVLNALYSAREGNWILPKGVLAIEKAAKGMEAKILKIPEVKPLPKGYKS